MSDLARKLKGLEDVVQVFKQSLEELEESILSPVGGNEDEEVVVSKFIDARRNYISCLNSILRLEGLAHLKGKERLIVLEKMGLIEDRNLYIRMMKDVLSYSKGEDISVGILHRDICDVYFEALGSCYVPLTEDLSNRYSKMVTGGRSLRSIR